MNKIGSDILTRLGFMVCPELAHSKTRDNPNCLVFKDKSSRAYFVADKEPFDREAFYRDQPNYWPALKDHLRAFSDAARRIEQLGELIQGEKVLDFGFGSGAFLFMASKLAKVSGLELQVSQLDKMEMQGIPVSDDLARLKGSFDVVTMFHVVEHLTDPVGTLQGIKRRMVQGGTIVIEVPHANDFLLSVLKLKAFKAHTFLSEHILLHSKASLIRLVAEAGFSDIKIEGYQRYGLKNHLSWLFLGVGASGRVSGGYSWLMKSLGTTDTLICTARKA